MFQTSFELLSHTMKGKSKSKSRNKVKHGVVKKKSFLDNQRKHKQNVKRVMKDPSLKEDETRVRFETFSSQVSGIKSSIVYQLAGRGNIKVRLCRQCREAFNLFYLIWYIKICLQSNVYLQ